MALCHLVYGHTPKQQQTPCTLQHRAISYVTVTVPRRVILVRVIRSPKEVASVVPGFPLEDISAVCV
eukprot:16440346-Heterocapsa_arctica.AAC.1